MHVVGGKRELSSELALVAERDLVRVRDPAVGGVEEHGAVVARQRAIREELGDAVAVEHGAVYEHRIGRQPALPRPRIGTIDRELRHEGIREHALRTNGSNRLVQSFS